MSHEVLSQRSSNSKVELELATHGRAQTVEELTGARTAHITLHITRVEVISDIENCDADARPARPQSWHESRYRETFYYLRVERKECGKASRFITRLDEIQSLVDE